MTDVTPIYRRTTYRAISPTAPGNDQSGRTVMVVGASQGIGFHIAQSYAEANAAKVILTSRSQAKLDDAVNYIKGKGVEGEISSRNLDASDVSQIEQLWQRLSDEGTFVDVLVLNASAVSFPQTTADLVNYFHFNVTSKLYFLEHFKNQRSPQGKQRQRILIDLTSAAAHAYPYPLHVYAASKAAFSNYICHLAGDMPETELRLVTLHPGGVWTDASSSTGISHEDSPFWDHPSLSAHMAVWLSTPAAAFLHGRFLWANWDVDGLLALKEKIMSDPEFLRFGVTGVSGGFTELMAKVHEVPPPKDRSWH